MHSRVSASSLWNTVGVAPINAGVAVAAEIAIIEKADGEKEAAWQKEVDKMGALLVEVTEIEQRSRTVGFGGLGVTDLSALIKFVFATRPRVKGDCASGIKGKDAMVTFMTNASNEWREALTACTADGIVGAKPKRRLERSVVDAASGLLQLLEPVPALMQAAPLALPAPAMEPAPAPPGVGPPVPQTMDMRDGTVMPLAADPRARPRRACNGRQ